MICFDTEAAEQPRTHAEAKAPERMALAAMVSAPWQSKRDWWTLYLALRRDREASQKVSR